MNFFEQAEDCEEKGNGRDIIKKHENR